MNYKYCALILLLVCCIIPASAVDTFTINTIYNAPTYYTIDYGEYTTASVYNYSINSTETLVANQSWLLLGSTNGEVNKELNAQYGIAFTADVGKNFTVAAPDYYRYYYLVFTSGFYDPTTVLTLKLYANTTSTPAPYVTVTTTIVTPTQIPMLPAAKREPAPYRFVEDNLIWIVIIILVVVGWLVMRKR